MAKKHNSNKRPKNRYGVLYFLDARAIRQPDVYGSTETLANAFGNAARHVARADMILGEYRKAVVYDKWEERIIRIYSRTAMGIAIKEY